VEGRRRARLRGEVESLAAARFRTRVADAFDAAPAIADDLVARRVDPYRTAAILEATVAAGD
jgi:hypothetical protein